jgi:hypothetical protein
MTEEKKSWNERLKKRWGLESGWQLVWVLVAFAATGFTIMFLKKPVLQLFLGDGEKTTLFSILYYIFILPVYFTILFVYGTLLGQRKFFSWFIMKTVNRFRRTKQ